MSWPKVSLEKHVDLVSGPAFKSAKFTENKQDVPLVKGDNIAQGYIDWKKSKYWPQNDVENYSQYWLEEGDVILAMDRPWVTAGLKYSWIKSNDPRALLVQRVARIRGQNGLLTDYLRYVVSSKHFSDYIKNIMGGTNVPHISGKQIKAYEISLPSEPIQEEIIKHLKNYDDLIENNKRRIELLEESARQLYKEWFVRFRFPGHEHVKIIDGVPEGWERCTASQALDVNPKAFVEKGKEILYVPMASLSESQMTVDASRFELRKKHTTVKFKHGDTLFARITPCLENGKTAYVNFLDEKEVACGSTEFIVLRGNKVSNQFAYLLSREESFRGNAIKSMIGSSGRQRVQPSCFDKYIVAVAPSTIQEQFDEVVGLAFKQIGVLINQNNQLAKARDLLLPKLMNGEIAV